MARVNHDIEPDWAEEGRGGDPAERAPCPATVDDPIESGFTLLKLGRLRVRVHWVVLLYLVCELLAWLPPDRPVFRQVGVLAGLVLAVALIREVGRGAVARWLGSRIDHVTVWPLGGLNSVVAGRPRHPVLAESGGLLVNAALVPALAVAVVGAGLPRAALMFDPRDPLAVLGSAVMAWTPWRSVLWSAYYANALVLAVNLLPMFPMDGGRILSAAVRTPATTLPGNERAGRFGMFTAAAVFILGATMDQTRVMAIAACGFLGTLIEFRRAGVGAQGPGGADVAVEPMGRRAAPGRRAHGRAGAGRDDGDLDRVLTKISREGLASLTVSEREVLARETERRRRG